MSYQLHKVKGYRHTDRLTDRHVQRNMPLLLRRWALIWQSYILTLPHPQGHLMSVKYEELMDELTVQVWLLYNYQNFKYCTLFVSGTELRMDRRTYITRCLGRTFQSRGIKTFLSFERYTCSLYYKKNLHRLRVFLISLFIR